LIRENDARWSGNEYFERISLYLRRHRTANHHAGPAVV